jgi:pimeloyl-ACP methyl ester carboxylesterase
MELKVDGKTAFATTLGRELDPAKLSAIFIHGAGLDHTVWTLPMRYFARHGRNVLAVDLPGHGRSQGPPLESIEDMADWVAHVLVAAGVEQAAIIGHSMGSLVAFETVVRHPECARALALLGISAPMPVHDRLLEAAKADDHAAVDMLTIWGHSHVGQVGGVGTPGIWMTGGNMKLLQRAGAGVIHADLKACNDYGDGSERAVQIKCPTLVIVGNRDVMTPSRIGKHIGGLIPEAEVVVLNNCGHAMLTERPNEVLDALIKIV